MVMIELMNDNFFRWKELVDFRHARVMRKNNDMTDLDVAFVEGAITNEKDEEELKKIRQSSKKLVTIGSCAINGMPAAQRNNFNEELKKEIEFLIQRFNQAEKVKRGEARIVKVDDEVEGCPMEEKVFLEKLDKYLKEFGVIDAQVDEYSAAGGYGKEVYSHTPGQPEQDGGARKPRHKGHCGGEGAQAGEDEDNGEQAFLYAGNKEQVRARAAACDIQDMRDLQHSTPDLLLGGRGEGRWDYTPSDQTLLLRKLSHVRHDDKGSCAPPFHVLPAGPVQQGHDT